MKYTGENKKQAFDKINNDYITPKKIFSLLKNIEPTLESHNTYREYTYNIKIKELDTEIIVRTTKEEITQISINNAFMSYLLKYDTNHRRYEKEVTYDDEHIIVDNKKIKIYQQMDPINLPWKDL
jgi:hypothetical protein